MSTFFQVVRETQQAESRTTDAKRSRFARRLGRGHLVLFPALAILAACGSRDAGPQTEAPSAPKASSAKESAIYLDSEGGDGTARGRTSWTEAHRAVAEDALKPVAAPSAHAAVAPETETAVTLREAAAKKPGELVTVSVRLAEPADGGLDLLDVPVAERQEAYEAYERRVAPAQDALVKQIAHLGGRELNRKFLSNHVMIELPADRVQDLIALPGVLGIARNVTHTNYTVPAGATGYDGNDVRNALRLTYPIAEGLNGAGESVGIIAGGPIPPEHWNMQGRYAQWYCTDSGCVQLGCFDQIAFFGSSYLESDPMNVNCQWGTLQSGAWVLGTPSGMQAPNMTATNHGSYVADIAGGSIEGGQDPSASTTLDRVARSGVAPGATIHNYITTDTNAMASALAQAVINGDKAVAIAVGFNCTGSCAANTDTGGIAADLAAAENAGTAIIVAAGDYPGMGFPAVRPEVLSVGYAASNPVANPNPDVAPHLSGTATGPLPLNVYGEGTRNEAGIGLDSPGDIGMMGVVNSLAPAGDHLYLSSSWAPDGYLGPYCGSGDSFSAPQIAGAAGIMAQAYGKNGWGLNGWTMLAALLAQGDGFDDASNSIRVSGLSNTSGGGHFHMHYPNGDGNMAAPWAWGNDAFTLATGQDHIIQWGVLPATATEWKIGLVWNETYANGTVADVDVYVYSLGNGNCTSSPVLLASQTDWDIHNKITLTGSQVANQCLQIKVHGYSIPPEGRTIYSVNYYHGGTID